MIHNYAPESGAGRAEAVPLERLELRPDVGRVDDEVLLRRDRAPPEVTQAYDVRNDKAGDTQYQSERWNCADFYKYQWWRTSYVGRGP